MAEGFQPRFVDLVRNYSTTKGTSNFVLGPAVNGFRSFSAAVQPGDQFYYSAIGVEKPDECEVGRGTMQADGTISRAPVSGAPTDFTSGTKSIALIAAAEWFNRIESGAGGVVPADSLESLRSAVISEPAVLLEPGREGTFKFVADDLSAKVAADPACGLYIAPASDPSGASGAWVRQLEGSVSPTWFGLSESNAASGNSAAIAAMLSALRARAANPGPNWIALETVQFPAGVFSLGETIELTEGSVNLEGSRSGGTRSGNGTKLVFPPGVTGIRVHGPDTEHSSGVRANGFGAAGSVIRDLHLKGGFAGTEGEAHGIQLRARATIENFYIEGFEGDGIHMAASAASGAGAYPPKGNVNNSSIRSGRVDNCRNGIFIDGADANICRIEGVDATLCRQWGFWDSSFLGNTYFACHSASNGRPTGTAPSSRVHYSGHRYFVMMGQEGWCSINPPSGDTTSNQGWGYLSTAGADANHPDWANGTTYRAGGAYHTDSNSAHNVFVGCYDEGGQGLPQFIRPTLVLGGNLSNAIVGDGGTLSTTIGALLTNLAFRARYVGAVSVREAQVGENGPSGAILYSTDSVAAPNVHRFKYSGMDIRFDYQNANANVAFWITGPNTTEQLGSGVAKPHYLVPVKLAVGPSVPTAREVTNGTAAPTSGSFGAGAICFNRTPAANGIAYWVCTVAGTPGTWAPVPLNGRVVTQAGANYTAQAPDSYAYVRFTSGSSVTFTIPPNNSVAFPIGTQIEIEQGGLGPVTVAAGTGVTVNSRGSDLTLAGQYAVAALKKVDTDTWTLTGDL